MHMVSTYIYMYLSGQASLLCGMSIAHNCMKSIQSYSLDLLGSLTTMFNLLINLGGKSYLWVKVNFPAQDHVITAMKLRSKIPNIEIQSLMHIPLGQFYMLCAFISALL